jgi:hypothetical protein
MPAGVLSARPSLESRGFSPVFGLPRRASLLWLIVVVGGAFSIVWSARLAFNDLRLVPIAALFVVAASIAESFRVALPGTRPGQSFDESVRGAVTVAAMVVLPPHWAVLIAAVAMGIGSRSAWFKRTFNVCQLSLSTAPVRWSGS